MATENRIAEIKKEEAIDELKKMVKHLVEVEEEVVGMTKSTIEKAENPVIKLLVRAIQHDSRKHVDL
ncbi:MAG: hypothetical protein ACM3N7_02160, partial [Planctomycetaceae bacterium]